MFTIHCLQEYLTLEFNIIRLMSLNTMYVPRKQKILIRSIILLLITVVSITFIGRLMPLIL